MTKNVWRCFTGRTKPKGSTPNLQLTPRKRRPSAAEAKHGADDPIMVYTSPGRSPARPSGSEEADEPDDGSVGAFEVLARKRSLFAAGHSFLEAATEFCAREFATTTSV